jgi:protein-S-isoprenylcysteine O-methyltransferase Ste14
VKATLGKLLYGLGFAVVLPVALAAWAHALAPRVTLRAYESFPVGAALGAVGVAVVLLAMRALWTHGGGLPMNAYPPPRFVARGPYALTRHPIYAGFVAACAGAAIAAGSAAGLWVIAPLVALACAALVLGFEGRDLDERFGPRSAPWLRIPEDADRAPSWGERIAAYALVLVPWGVAYEAVVFLGPPPDAVDGALALDRAIPVVEEAEAVYATAYIAALAAPLVARTSRDLRRFMTRGLLASALVFPLYVAIPLVATPKAFVAHGALGRLLLLERGLDTPAGAFPSFHVIWALVTAEALGGLRLPSKIAARTWAWAVVASCVLTGMHTLIDVAGGVIAALLVFRARSVWEALRSTAERVAASWREARLGPLRVINHGAWGGLATALGLLVTGALAGRAYVGPMLVAATLSLVVAGGWAQLVEGSPALLRPYGFYGGVLGIIAGCFSAPLFDLPTWPLLGAFCVAAPLVQATGRLRCLVQGCCHGSPAPEGVGIRYTHPRSRVCRIAHLADVPLHPTPLYSIVWSAFVLIVLARMWWLRAEVHLVAGVYLALSGIGRFVEESYRGEPQTKIVAKLRLYQWIATVQVAAGVIVTVLGPPQGAPAPRFAEAPFGAAMVFGLLVALASGVDFPESNRRFSRLA